MIAVFAFCFVLLENIWSTAQSREKPQPNTQQTQQQPQADKRGTLDAPFVVKPLPAEKNQQEADEDARDKSEKRWNDRITIFVAIATAVILILQLIVFGWQAHRLKQTMITMKELGEKQSKDMQGWIAVADKSTEAAKRTADAAVYRARAYVYAFSEGGKLGFHPESHEITGFSFKIKNGGETPAHQFRYAAKIAVFEFPFSGVSVFDMSPIDIEDGQSIIPLAPKEEYMAEGGSARRFPYDEIISILAGNKKRFYCFGVIKYFDVFGEERTTTFCYTVRLRIPVAQFEHEFRIGTGQPFITAYTSHDNKTD